jgi:hypothetical protein
VVHYRYRYWLHKAPANRVSINNRCVGRSERDHLYYLLYFRIIPFYSIYITTICIFVKFYMESANRIEVSAFSDCMADDTKTMLAARMTLDAEFSKAKTKVAKIMTRFDLVGSLQRQPYDGTTSHRILVKMVGMKNDMNRFILQMEKLSKHNGQYAVHCLAFSTNVTEIFSDLPVQTSPSGRISINILT